MSCPVVLCCELLIPAAAIIVKIKKAFLHGCQVSFILNMCMLTVDNHVMAVTKVGARGRGVNVTRHYFGLNSLEISPYTSTKAILACTVSF